MAYDILVEVTSRELEAQSSRRKRAEEMLQQRMIREQLQEQLMEIFMEADADGSGSLDIDAILATGGVSPVGAAKAKARRQDIYCAAA